MPKILQAIYAFVEIIVIICSLYLLIVGRIDEEGVDDALKRIVNIPQSLIISKLLEQC